MKREFQAQLLVTKSGTFKEGYSILWQEFEDALATSSGGEDQQQEAKHD